MKRLPPLLIGLIFLSGSIVPPQTIIAQAPQSANQNAWQTLLTSTKKRDPNATLRAIQAVKNKQSASQSTKMIKRPSVNSSQTALLPVVNQEDILMKHRHLADEVLRSLPWQCQTSLKNFYVRYDNPSRRGLAGKNTIILDGSVPDEEFRALLIHEFGHITDLGCLQGGSASSASNFKDGSETIKIDDLSIGFYSISWADSKHQKTGSKDGDFVSGYAEWDPFEDFAETYAYFVLQNQSFRQRARSNHVLAEKYRWMGKNIFPSFELIAQGEYSWDGNVPWDTTKLSYEWKPEKTEVAVK